MPGKAENFFGMLNADLLKVFSKDIIYLLPHSTNTSIYQGRRYHVVVINPPLPRDGSTAQTAIHVHAVNLIEIRLEQGWANYAPRATCGPQTLFETSSYFNEYDKGHDRTQKQWCL